jgi:hypothetical protein
LKAPQGAEKIRDMMRDDIRAAFTRDDREHASELLMVLRHFLETHPGKPTVRFTRGNLEQHSFSSPWAPAEFQIELG